MIQTELFTFLDQFMPFHIVVSEHGQVVNCGRTIAKIYPEVSGAPDARKLFRFEQGPWPEQMSELIKRKISLKPNNLDLTLNGEVIAIDGFMETRYVFALAPFFTSMGAISALGLNLGDLPYYDAGLEYLTLFQSEKRVSDEVLQSERRLRQEKTTAQLLYRISARGDRSANWHKQFPEILADFCRELGFVAGRVLIANHKSEQLIASGVYHCDSAFSCPTIESPLGQVKYSWTRTPAGAVFETSALVWSEDVTILPENYALYPAWVKSSVSIPIMLHGRIFAIVEFFVNHPTKRDPSLMLFFDTAAKHFADVIALDKARKLSKRQEQAIFERNEELTRVNADLQLEISRRAAAQEQLLAEKERAEMASRAKSEFLANMSHEIRTPLNGILGMSYLLKQTSLSNRQQDQLEKITVSGQHLLSLINDILDLSKVEAGELSLETAPIEMAAIADDVAKMFREQSEGKNIALNVEVAPEIPRYLMGDMLRIKQILVNLVGNAIKFTDQGCVDVIIRASSSSEANDSLFRLQILVRDTGHGISEEARPKMFKLFSQADSSTTRKFGGTGLGLAITKKLIDAMQGAIDFTSKVNEGTTFCVDLPLAVVEVVGDDSTAFAASEITVSHESENKDYLAGRRVLVVEDNEINQMVVKTILQNWKMEVEVAENGSKAIEVLKERPFDLILMDCQMPIMNGFDATKNIRQLEGDVSHIPIVAMTANAIRGDQERCLAVGMDDYTTKPIRVDDLKELLEKHLRLTNSVVRSNEDVTPRPLAMEHSETNLHNEMNDDAVSMLKILKMPDGRCLYDVQIPLFIESSASIIENLRQLESSHQYDALRAEAHKFKSTCGVVGATSMFDACDRLEHLEAHDSKGKIATIETLASYFEQAKEYFRSAA